MDFPSFDGLPGDKVLEHLQQYCTGIGATDIHTSPEKDHVRLEIRLHGMLEKLTDLRHDVYEQFVRKVKFNAKLKLNITTIPQDGQYTFQMTEQAPAPAAPVQTPENGQTTISGEPSRTAASGEPSRTVNVRVATLPTRFGETLTLRILDPKRGIIPLTQLGFPEDMKDKLQTLATLPHGLILVTGPTGSGKTTTLYSLLSTLIGTKRNIITLEDPVEYEIDGIVQSQIDPDHDFTFASGLRSVLRHDPNVVLVGEIRDLETAQTAIDAALTGHLVLSTLHTNSAIEAIPRLLSMGVSPYTFAPALRAILAQRLIRTLSEEAKQTETYDPTAPESYAGRMVLPELLTVTDTMRNLILSQEGEKRLGEQAKTDGYLTMKEWGDILAEQKVTSREEIARVTS